MLLQRHNNLHHRMYMYVHITEMEWKAAWLEFVETSARAVVRTSILIRGRKIHFPLSGGRIRTAPRNAGRNAVRAPAWCGDRHSIVVNKDFRGDFFLDALERLPFSPFQFKSGYGLPGTDRTLMPLPCHNGLI